MSGGACGWADRQAGGQGWDGQASGQAVRDEMDMQAGERSGMGRRLVKDGQ